MWRTDRQTDQPADGWTDKARCRVACTRLIMHYGGAWWVTCDAWYHCCTKCFKTARDMVRPSMPHYDCTCCVTIVHVVSRPWRVTAARDVSWLHVVCHGRAWRVTAVRNVLQPRMTCHGRACVTATRDTSQPRMTRHDCALRSPCLTRNNWVTCYHRVWHAACDACDALRLCAMH